MTSSPPGVEVAPLEATIGRYLIERTLGEGGMGVVHAAYDPELERRVALKVLRVLDGGGEARQRLLREARAMARVTHPNVVAVYEVGSAGGRDYVAMELVDGETLEHWVRAARRSPARIIAAFVAAGRGLAAAHEAGLVHRDFKPRNVLRRRDGRIVVTDFGLARGVEVEPEHTFDVTNEPAAPHRPSSLSGLTVTGSVLGTPAYMAPEQWNGGVVGPASDQFAFCVALWEMLTGARPFLGATLAELEKEIRRGSAALDLSQLPRGVRRALRRGLDPDPERRWPNMEALLAAIARGRRAPRIALAAVAAAVVAAAGAYELLGRGDASCAAPTMDPAAVWSPERSAALARADQHLAAEAIAHDVDAWHAARIRVCRDEHPRRDARLACLDAVLGRLDAVARAVAAAREPRVDAGQALIDPAICERAQAPRLAATTPALVEAIARWLETAATMHPLEPAQADAIVAAAGADPCAAALAHALAASTTARQLHLDEAESAARRCSDDRIEADVAILAASSVFQDVWLDRETTAKVARAEALVGNLPQRDLEAQLDLLRVSVAVRSEDLDQAIARADAAAAGFAARRRTRPELEADLEALELREQRGKTEELAAVPERLAEWRASAVTRIGVDDAIVRHIDYAAASWSFATGDLATAHAMYERLRRPSPNDPQRHVTGRVVDATGTPVAGALVTAGTSLRGDSISIALSDSMVAAHVRQTKSAADGTFEIVDAVRDGAIIAQRENERSPATVIADGVTLRLAPTSRLVGSVDLRGEPPTHVKIIAYDQAAPPAAPYLLVAPVQRDASFVLDGVPRGRIVVRTQVDRATAAVVRGSVIDVRAPELRVQLGVGTSARMVHVIVRSAIGLPVPNAQVIVLPGVVASASAAVITKKLESAVVRLARQPEQARPPRAVLAQTKPGDLYAKMTDIPDGTVSACAVALSAGFNEATQLKIVSQLDKIEFQCAVVSPDQDVIVLEVQPPPRLE